ncbi:uncharacterized protein LOC142232836 [Haematobia irritans]|uniref:uncharacterized protein LOC142232836 n=1 Tax=Haematobia irritans TaxID=7368 RepID=UPI003F50D3C6
MNTTNIDLGSREDNFTMMRILANYTTGINICHINTQSLNNKIDEFRILFEHSGIDAVCVSETWFHPDCNDETYKLNGYRLFRADRQTNGGGVAIYLRNTLRCNLIDSSESFQIHEHLFLEVLCNDTKILLGCIYRPNRQVSIEPIISKLESISVEYSDIVITGDFNSNVLLEKNLVDAMETLNLNLVNSCNPTHFSTTVNTLLDLVFVNNNERVLHYDQLSGSGFSKHDIILLSYDCSITSQINTYTYRDFKRINISALECDLSNKCWTPLYFLSTSEEKTRYLTDEIINLYNQHVPLVIKTVTPKLRPWFKEDTKLLIEKRDKAYRRWKRYKTPSLYKSYKIARNKVVAKVKKDKILYYDNKFNRAIGSKQTWKGIQEICGIKKRTVVSYDINVDELNEKFVNLPIPEIEDNITVQQPLNIDAEQILTFYNVRALISIKSNATGYDDINPKFVKLIAPQILRPLTHVINFNITTSTFPNIWKCSKVIPIEKALKEFRPISILPFLSKVFEKLIHEQIYTHLQNRKLLSNSQSGFRSNHSCLTALVDVSESLRYSLDNNEVSVLILLDHSKSFDSVHYPTLCRKLSDMFAFSDTATRLIASYLKDRQQFTVHQGQSSSSLPLKRGVPQGSILGPLLYTMYSNDLPNVIQHSYNTTIESWEICNVKKRAREKMVFALRFIAFRQSIIAVATFSLQQLLVITKLRDRRFLRLLTRSFFWLTDQEEYIKTILKNLRLEDPRGNVLQRLNDHQKEHHRRISDVAVLTRHLDSSSYPDCLKISKVTPIPKVSNSTQLHQFRPISVLPVLDLVVEKLI